jgi:HEPN domain-containing protein
MAISIKPGSVLIFNSSEKIVDWINWADADYLAARQLLLGNLLVPGAALSNTAIEKYFKTILLIRKVPSRKVHDLPRLFGMLNRAGVLLNLNQDYLNLLSRLYKLRYPDEVESGLNLSIDRTRLLTELDYSVFEIKKGFQLTGPFGPVSTAVDEFLKRNDARLVEKNCYFGTANRETLFGEESARYSIKSFGSGLLSWTFYETYGVPDNRNFKVGFEGSLSGNSMTFRLPLE